MTDATPRDDGTPAAEQPPTQPAPLPWEPPSPLSFGPPAPPAGPLVSPAIAAYRPSAAAWPTAEPATGPIQVTAEPPTAPIHAAEPPTSPIRPEPAAPVTSPPYGLPTSPPVAFHPVPVAPVPVGPVPVAPVPAAPAPAPASYYPPSVPPYLLSVPPYPSVPPYFPTFAGYPGFLPPYGVDPATGQPLSDKTRLGAGLLQLLFAVLLALGGIGRLYAGQTSLGVSQVALSVVGWTAFWFGFATSGLTWLLSAALWIWFVTDGVLVLTGRPVDEHGRLLR